jgi:hypothetical protein
VIPNIWPHQKNIFPNTVPLTWLTTKNMKIWLSWREVRKKEVLPKRRVKKISWNITLKVKVIN